VSTDPSGAPGGPGAVPGGAQGQPSEEELRAAYEAELSRITSADMMLQAAVSLLNIGSYRLAGPPPAGSGAGGADEGAQAASGRDLEQARDAIDGVRALLEILQRRIPNELGPLRNALSQLQMAYARETQASGREPAGAQGDAPPGQSQPPGAGAPGRAPDQGQAPAEGQPQQGQGSHGPGPAESSGRLWVPGR
jgi:hypothetical protein